MIHIQHKGLEDKAKLNQTQTKTIAKYPSNQNNNKENLGKVKKRDKDGMVCELLKDFQKVVG